MDVSSIARLATTIADTGNRQDVGIAVLKKAQDLQASSAAALVEAIPPVPQAGNGNLPPHLGTRINTTA
ncbi:YjfB family protein [Massilia endophytica]|uniref:YjfB family protein n=1 Tax=Massilia endophytica TaxID=2899220 RepID=UPI001E4F7A3B|nr:YjfB family protein [Massilia endophytica]UGQ47514.1 YjfB family protein [Massilia endophytica]